MFRFSYGQRSDVIDAAGDDDRTIMYFRRPIAAIEPDPKTPSRIGKSYSFGHDSLDTFLFKSNNNNSFAHIYRLAVRTRIRGCAPEGAVRESAFTRWHSAQMPHIRKL